MVATKRGALRLLAIAAALLMVTAACGSDSESDDATATTGGSGSGVKCKDLSIGFFGALTGPNANLGINIKQGAELAINQWNDDNPDCQVGYEKFDSQGSATEAPALAQKAVQNAKVVAVVGPAFSGESKVANPILDEAGLPLITPSATGTSLSANGWKVFHRAVGNDNSQGPAAASYMTGELNVKKAAIIDDASEYGKGISDIVRDEFKAEKLDVAVSESIDPKAQDYSSTVTKIKGANVDAIFFGGYYAEAGRLVKQLRDGGVKATFVAPDGVLDQGFIDAAGATSAEGSILTCPCAPISEIAGGAEFQAAYKAEFKQDPGTYSAEGFDAANALLDAIKAGNTTRAAINTHLNTKLNYKGITKTLKFDSKGEITDLTLFAYKVQDGKIVPIGPIKD